MTLVDFNQFSKIFLRIKKFVLSEVKTRMSKPKSVSFAISVGSWISNGNNSAYNYRCDILVDGLKSTDIATVSVSPGSQSVAANCGLCPTNETLNGKIRLFAKNIPSDSISGEYYILEGRSD